MTPPRLRYVIHEYEYTSLWVTRAIMEETPTLYEAPRVRGLIHNSTRKFREYYTIG